MSGKTSIEWATVSWNPTTGCTRVSAGCDNCYAFRLHDIRFAHNRKAAKAAGHRTAAEARAGGGLLPFAAQYDLPFSRIQIFEKRLQDPFRWPHPERVFVDSMADLLHEDVPDAFIDRVFDVMERADRHVYQLLTKRPDRLAHYLKQRYGQQLAPAHVWVGTSVEDDRVLDRVDRLREAPARVRFLSCEPLIGSLAKLRLEGIHWVIAGGESGPRRRAVDPRWIRDLRDKCASADVAFFFKQWGGLTPKAGGRELDGREWDEYPALQPQAALA